MPLTNARRKAYSKGYYENNTTRILTAERERYAAHSDEKKAAERDRYASHSDQKKAAERERYASHSDEKREVCLSF